MRRTRANPDRRGGGRGGFTLIELLLSVTLLVLIVLVSSYIFDTTMGAVSQTQANNELNVSLETFAQLLRKDVRGIEHDNFLVLGARQHAAFATAKDRANGRKRTFRHDWMMFFLNSEHDASGDALVLGQAARVLYGHGKVADPEGWDFIDQTSNRPLTSGQTAYSNLATDWVVMRHQMSMLPKVYENPGNPGSLYGLAYENIEHPEETPQYGSKAMFVRSLLSPYVRDFRWSAWYNSQWEGSTLVSYGQDGRPSYGNLAIYEPFFYHFMTVRHRDPRRFHALPHCAHLAVQFALPEDLSAIAGGAIRWRDPPHPDDDTYLDPNYRPNDNDPLHPTAIVPAYVQHRFRCPNCGVTTLRGMPVQERTCPACDLVGSRGTYQVYAGAIAPRGRLSFGPGDRWPVLLRVEAHIYDPLDRLDGGKKVVLVVPVP